jgi:hypothetical protein
MTSLSRVVKLTETENRMCPWWGRKGNGDLFNGYRVSILQDESHGNWLHNNANTPDTVNCTLNNGLDDKFC